jgi:hypothetical protein
MCASALGGGPIEGPQALITEKILHLVVRRNRDICELHGKKFGAGYKTTCFVKKFVNDAATEIIRGITSTL